MTAHDLYDLTVYKPTPAENYVFFDFAEGYVSHSFVASLSPVDIDCYLHEWMSKSKVSVDDLRKVNDFGGYRFWLTYLVMCVHDSKISEFPETEVHMDDAQSALLTFISVFTREM